MTRIDIGNGPRPVKRGANQVVGQVGLVRSIECLVNLLGNIDGPALRDLQHRAPAL